MLNADFIVKTLPFNTPRKLATDRYYAKWHWSRIGCSSSNVDLRGMGSTGIDEKEELGLGSPNIVYVGSFKTREEQNMPEGPERPFFTRSSSKENRHQGTETGLINPRLKGNS